MKIRTIAIQFTLVMAMLLTLTYVGMRRDMDYRIDMASLNANYKEVVQGLEEGISRNSLEKDYTCNIYLKADSDYSSNVMLAIEKSNIVLDYEENDLLLGKIVFSGAENQIKELRTDLWKKVFGTSLVILVVGYLLLFVIWYFYIRPFDKLKNFAANIAKGELDTPLTMTKGNYFGAFTESFDIMREELKQAKENEYKANVSKKELVAELSHDMKTPIATIKATCDVLKVKGQRSSTIDSSEMMDKVGVIEQKAEMMDKLIGNMFHATLEELQNLKVEPVETPSTQIIKMFDDLRFYENIHILNKMPECLLYMDELRLQQVIDNIVNNSYKYANTKIDVSFTEQENEIIIGIRDYGQGVEKDEIPLITEKYYRGGNSKGKNGAGLGLFLSKYFMDHMSGAFECYTDGGFVVNLMLRKV